MPAPDLPIALAKWFDYVKWVWDRVGGFPKNRRFVLGTRLADTVLELIMLHPTFTASRPASQTLARRQSCAGRSCGSARTPLQPRK
jgi:hypothetical protein